MGLDIGQTGTAWLPHRSDDKSLGSLQHLMFMALGAVIGELRVPFELA